MSHRPPRKAAGFTLIEIAVVIVIVAVMISMGTVMLRGVVGAQKRSMTVARLAAIETALVQYVVLNKRLPCPANGTIASTGVNPGVEARDAVAQTCTGNQQFGVVPWVSLGISETDAMDGWGRRITYRTDGDLVFDNAMNLSSCDPAGGAGLVVVSTRNVCNPACSGTTNCTAPITYLADGSDSGKGLRVQDTASPANVLMTPPNTGAAYVLISHGESGGGGYLDTGILSSSTATDGAQEQLNYANLALRSPPNYYVDAPINDTGTGHFDDLVARASVLVLAAKAGLNPRSHP